MESESVTPSELSEGDELQVTYVPTTGDGNDETVLETEIVEVEVDVVGGYEFGKAYVSEYRDEDDTLCRRRLKCQPEADWTLEYRRTTKNGAEWQRMNEIATCEVSRS